MTNCGKTLVQINAKCKHLKSTTILGWMNNHDEHIAQDQVQDDVMISGAVTLANAFCYLYNL